MLTPEAFKTILSGMGEPMIQLLSSVCDIMGKHADPLQSMVPFITDLLQSGAKTALSDILLVGEDGESLSPLEVQFKQCMSALQAIGVNRDQ